MIAATRTRSTGTCATLSLYADAVKSPRKRRSPVTLPLSSNVFTPT